VCRLRASQHHAVPSTEKSELTGQLHTPDTCEFKMGKRAANSVGVRNRPKSSRTDSTHAPNFPRIAWVAGTFGFASLILAFFLYRPALGGPFMFDDLGLPFSQPAAANQPLNSWLAGVRPVLMLSYWLDFQIAGRSHAAYHATNVLLHAANSVLVLLLFWSVLRLQPIQAGRALLCATAAAGIFLIHPLQTESVAYIAGRSELVCGFFVLSALTLFCWTISETISWRTAAAILVLYGAACLSKEQAAVLPAVLLAADIVFGQRSPAQALRRGVRLYGPLAAAGVLAVIGVASVLARSTSAGFNVTGFQWYEYLFTQPTVWLLYLRLAVFPFGQNADYDLDPARSFFQFDVIVSLIALLIAAYFVWRMRRSWPLAAGGLLVFAILLAPTSSFVPIQDLAAERRMYLPLVGLLFAFVQFLANVRASEAVTAGLVAAGLVFSALTYERAKVWSSDVALWSDIVRNAPEKPRGYTHLVLAYVRAKRCSEAVTVAEKAPGAVRSGPEFLGALGHAYTCDKKLDQAVKAFEMAAHNGPSVGRLLALSSAYRAVQRFDDAAATEVKATSLPPRTPYDFYMLEALQKMNQSGSRTRIAP
jgi:protein O-mannosyl-transferase